mgnify:CR=1 FL=1
MITPYFAVPYGEERLDINNKKIIDYAYSLREKHGWSDQGYQTPWLELDTPEIQEILQAVNKHLDYLRREVYKFNEGAEFFVQNCWANITDPDHTERFAHNNFHSHSGYFISLVYYLKAQEDNGDLTLVNPNQLAEFVVGAIPDKMITEFNLFNSNRLNIVPFTGMLVSFPAYVQHYAHSNKGKDTRISMAFNAQVRPKKI